MLAVAVQIELPAIARDQAAPSDKGVVIGGVRVLLRLEGTAVFAAAIALYAYSGFSWALFALLFLAPDLFMLGYLVGPRTGAAVYNFAHTYTVALALALAGLFLGSPTAAACGLILIAHIGFDRALGYGVKYATAFGDSHLGRIGRR
ncbi:MAG TPA: DUF4260 domain-containing protein [Xanthobacteraceae bacterium]|nr:DUF4260 domain-containing protein [Xanthobacteraceae bacterium]